MGTSWLDKYLGGTPQDATAVAPKKAASAPVNTVGPATRPDFAMHTLPAPFADRVQQALNALGAGNPLPHLYDAQQAAEQGHPGRSLLALAAAVPLIPEAEVAKPLGFLDAATSIARPGAEEAARMAAAHTANGAEMVKQLAGLGAAEPAVEHLKNAQQLAMFGAHDDAALRVAQARVNAGSREAFDKLMEKFPSLQRYAPKAPVPTSTVPGVMSGEDPSLFSRMQQTFSPEPLAIKLSGKQQKYADLLRRQGVKNPEAQALRETPEP